MDKTICPHWDCPYKCCKQHEFHDPEAYKPLFWEDDDEPIILNPESCQRYLDL